MARVGIISTQEGFAWGGSEVLWSQAAERMLRAGHDVTINYREFIPEPAPVTALRARGARVFLRRWPGRVGARLDRLRARLSITVDRDYRPWLNAVRPDFVLISAAFHDHELTCAQVLRDRGVPYALLLQAINPGHWMSSGRARIARDAYSGARACYFLSPFNKECLEDQIGCSLTNARFVSNPAQTPFEAPLPWPDDEGETRVACVGRLQPQAKGQDLIIRAIADPQWDARGLQLSLFGTGDGEERLRAMVDRLELGHRVRFCGEARPEEVWRRHHGLLLCSRFEGSPLVLNEAMLCGRVPIVMSDWCRHLVSEGRTGFLAAGASVSCVQDALERAWIRRPDWGTIGERAAQSIRERVDPDPADALARELLALC